MIKKWKQAWAFTLSIVIVIVVSLAACGDYSSNVASLAPMQTPDVEPTDSVNLQETPSTQSTEEGQKYHIIKYDWYDENETLVACGECEYDKNGNVSRISSYSLDGIATGVTTYEYDFYQDGTLSEKRMTWETLEWIEISDYSYDNHGNLIAFDTQKQEKNPVEDGRIYLGGYSEVESDLGYVYSYAIRTFTYDSNGRAIRFDMTDKKSGEALGWGEITYDATGSLVTYNVYNRDGELSYQGETLYDADHRVLSKKYMKDGEITDWHENEYDKYGHLISGSTHISAGDYTGRLSICIYDSESKFLPESTYWDDRLMSRREATEWILFPTAE